MDLLRLPSRAPSIGASSMTNAPVRPLTPRQQQIADHLARGLSYPEIAAELGISVGTVRNYACQAMDRIPNPEGLKPRALLRRLKRH